MLDDKKYKEFIPKNFQEKNIKLQRKGRKKAAILIVILNFIMLPLNINALNVKNNKKTKIKEEAVIADDTINIKNIEKWLEINKLEITLLNVENNQGKVLFKDGRQIYKLEDLGFKILKVEEKEESLEVGISL